MVSHDLRRVSDAVRDDAELPAEHRGMLARLLDMIAADARLLEAAQRPAGPLPAGVVDLRLERLRRMGISPGAGT